MEPGSFSTNLHGNRMENDMQCYTRYNKMEQVKAGMINGIASAIGKSKHNRDPSEFSQLIAKLINEDILELRHVVGTVATEGVHQINEFVKTPQDNLFKKFGL